MESLEPLHLNREWLKMFYMRAIPEEMPCHIWWRRRILVSLLLAQLLSGSLLSFDFIVKFIDTDLEDALFAVFQVVGDFAVFFTAFITYIYPKPVQTIFIKFKHIRENGKNKNPPPFRIILNLSAKNRVLMKLLILFSLNCC